MTSALEVEGGWGSGKVDRVREASKRGCAKMRTKRGAKYLNIWQTS